MLVELLRLALVAVFVAALPGVALVNALLPRGAVRGATRVYLSLAAGVLLLTLVGVVLGFLPHGERGWFQTLATGAPNLELAMLAATVLLFYVGLVRGAYPRLAARVPRLVRPEGRAPVVEPPRLAP